MKICVIGGGGSFNNAKNKYIAAQAALPSISLIVNTKGNCYYIQYQPELKTDNVHLSTNGFKDLATVLMDLIKRTSK